MGTTVCNIKGLFCVEEHYPVYRVRGDIIGKVVATAANELISFKCTACNQLKLPTYIPLDDLIHVPCLACDGYGVHEVAEDSLMVYDEPCEECAGHGHVPERKFVSLHQRELMLHALGKDYEDVAFRNHFQCPEEEPEWEDLIGKGFATKRPWANSIIYHVSKNDLRLLQIDPREVEE